METQEAFPARGAAVHRVAVVAYTQYAYDARVRREAEALSQSGSEVYVISLGSVDAPCLGRLDGVWLYELPLAPKRGGKLQYIYQYALFLLLSTALLVYLDMRRRFDLVHVHSLPDFQILCTLPLRLRKVNTILDLHEAMPEILAARFHLTMTSRLVRVAMLLEQLSCRLATHVLAANDAIRARVTSRGVPPNRVTVVYNAGLPPALVANRGDVRKRLRLPGGRLLVHAGGINPERDLETLVDAAAQLGPELSATVLLAGGGEARYVDTLMKRAGRLGIRDRVLFLGRLSLDDARDLLSLSAVGLVTLEQNPLTEIALPSRAVEFASLSKPLILPRLTYMHEVFGQAAVYYSPGDAASLARSIVVTLRDPDLAKARIQIATEVCRRFDWGRAKTEFLNLCHNLGGANGT